jgi:hypothetical protein
VLSSRELCVLYGFVLDSVCGCGDGIICGAARDSVRVSTSLSIVNSTSTHPEGRAIVQRMPLHLNSISQLCDFLAPSLIRHSNASTRTYASRLRHNSHQTAIWISSIRTYSSVAKTQTALKDDLPAKSYAVKSHSNVTRASSANVSRHIPAVVDQGRAILSSESTIPSERQVIELLEGCFTAVQDLQVGKSRDDAPMEHNEKGSTLSAMMSLAEEATRPNAQPKKTIATLSRLAYDVVVFPTVFITPKILAAYVNLQTLLHRPRTLPEVFRLYATKSMPVEGSSPVKYTRPWSDQPKYAIPADVATNALESSIAIKDLSSAISIIETTYATPAFRRQRWLRKALPPLTGLSLAPAAAYVIASKMSDYQLTADSYLDTNVAFVGMMAYLGFTATIGMVAITTSNDQMDRVTWANGTPLRDRWTREDERAAFDKVAGAWGFKTESRRGEEEGQEWEELRELIGRRGMILDRVSLMEGME